MSEGNNTSGKKDSLLENIKEVIGHADKFNVEYSLEIVDAIVVTNEVNQIQNDVPYIAWVVITGYYQGIVEDVTDDFDAPTNMVNKSTQKKHCFLQGVLYIL